VEELEQTLHHRPGLGPGEPQAAGPEVQGPEVAVAAVAQEVEGPVGVQSGWAALPEELAVAAEQARVEGHVAAHAFAGVEYVVEDAEEVVAGAEHVAAEHVAAEHVVEHVAAGHAAAEHVAVDVVGHAAEHAGRYAGLRVAGGQRGGSREPGASVLMTVAVPERELVVAAGEAAAGGDESSPVEPVERHDVVEDGHVVVDAAESAVEEARHIGNPSVRADSGLAAAAAAAAAVPGRDNSGCTRLRG
jgi:hypothetical protein